MQRSSWIRRLARIALTFSLTLATLLAGCAGVTDAPEQQLHGFEATYRNDAFDELHVSLDVADVADAYGVQRSTYRISLSGAVDSVWLDYDGDWRFVRATYPCMTDLCRYESVQFPLTRVPPVLGVALPLIAAEGLWVANDAGARNWTLYQTEGGFRVPPQAEGERFVSPTPFGTFDYDDHWIPSRFESVGWLGIDSTWELISFQEGGRLPELASWPPLVMADAGEKSLPGADDELLGKPYALQTMLDVLERDSAHARERMQGDWCLTMVDIQGGVPDDADGTLLDPENEDSPDIVHLRLQGPAGGGAYSVQHSRGLLNSLLGEERQYSVVHEESITTGERCDARPLAASAAAGIGAWSQWAFEVDIRVNHLAQIKIEPLQRADHLSSALYHIAYRPEHIAWDSNTITEYRPYYLLLHAASASFLRLDLHPEDMVAFDAGDWSEALATLRD